MNVLEVYSSFLPKQGGVQRHIYDLCTSLAEKGHSSMVLSWTTSAPKTGVINGISAKQIHVPRIFSIMRYPLILYLSLYILLFVKKNKINIIHAHDYLPGVTAALAGILSSTPVIVTYHLPVQRTTFHSPAYLTPFVLIEKFLRICFNFWVSEIVCVSEFTLTEALKLGFPSSKLRLIYNWASCSPSSSNNGRLMPCAIKDLDLQKKTFILSVGRLYEKQKPFSLLIQAFLLLLEKGFDLDLVIVGNGPDKSRYENYASSLNVARRVHFLSGVSDADLTVLYMECKLFVLPSFLEGLPLVLLEAMVYSKPIVSTKVGGIPEVVTDGCNGLLVDPTSEALFVGMAQILSSSHLQREMGLKSKEIVSDRFSEQNLNATITLLKKSSRKFTI